MVLYDTNNSTSTSTITIDTTSSRGAGPVHELDGTGDGLYLVGGDSGSGFMLLSVNCGHRS